MSIAMRRRYILNLVLVILLILFLIEPSKSEKLTPSEQSKQIKQSYVSTLGKNRGECRCSSIPKCRSDQRLETIVGECCPRCVCKPCPPLAYDICIEGFKPQLEKASKFACCDNIICTSISSDEELTIRVKESSDSGNDFYMDETDDIDETAYNEDNEINVNSFQYDRNQVLDNGLATTGANQLSEDESSYDAQIKIGVRGDHLFSPINENEYYLEEKEYGLTNSSEEICHEVNCLDESFVTYKDKLACPEDSLIKLTDDIEQYCCQVSAKCECSKCERKPNKSWCKMAGDNFEPILVRKGESVPGKCCDIYICHSSNYTCNLNGAFYTHNSEWKLNPCTECRCDMGYITCKKIECPVLECDVKESLLSECCPVCTGECRSTAGDLFKSGESWKEDDDCTECKCVNGRKECIAELCQLPTCKNPVKKPGLCCHVCENNQNTSAFHLWQRLNPSHYPPHCRSKIENLSCPSSALSTCKYGPGIVDLDGNRCPTCRCSDRPTETCSFKCDDPTWTHMPLSDRLCKCPVPEEKCARVCNRHKMSCPNGFEKDLDGCDLCTCKDEIAKAENPNYCLDPETGVTIADGNMWFDGCRQCFCQKGVQYCSLISCIKTSSSSSSSSSTCLNSAATNVLKKPPNMCCPVCPFSMNESSLANTTVCEALDVATASKSSQAQHLWPLDKCTKCMCLGGVLLCSVNRCAPVTCTNPVLKSGECCAQCGPQVALLLSATSSSTFDAGSLSSRSTRRWSCIDSSENYREHDAKWRESDCLHCVCQDGDVKCFNHEMNCPRFSCKNEVRRKGECCPYCLDYANVPFNLSSLHLNSSYFDSHHSPLSNKIFVIGLTLALILAILFIITSICFIKILKRSKKSKPRRRVERYKPKKSSALNRQSAQLHSLGQHHQHQELIVHLNESPSSLPRPTTATSTTITAATRTSRHQLSSSANRLNMPVNENNYSSTRSAKTTSGTVGADGDYSKPLLGPKKYVISRSNLNANHSGSEISETSTNNDENSKSTILTGFSDQLNNSATGRAANYLPPLNSQICYF